MTNHKPSVFNYLAAKVKGVPPKMYFSWRHNIAKASPTLLDMVISTLEHTYSFSILHMPISAQSATNHSMSQLKCCFFWENFPKLWPEWLHLPYVLIASGIFLLHQASLVDSYWCLSDSCLSFPLNWKLHEGLCFVHRCITRQLIWCLANTGNL